MRPGAETAPDVGFYTKNPVKILILVKPVQYRAE